MSDATSNPAVQAAAASVLRSSASEPQSERFRLQLEQELRNAGITLSPEDLAAVQQDVVQGDIR